MILVSKLPDIGDRFGHFVVSESDMDSFIANLLPVELRDSKSSLV